MKKIAPAAIQKATPFGGSLNLLPKTYKVSESPIGDEALYGPLAHVTPMTRKKIMATGFGEMQSHIEHIEKAIGYTKKMRHKQPGLQLGLDFGE